MFFSHCCFSYFIFPGVAAVLFLVLSFLVLLVFELLLIQLLFIIIRIVGVPYLEILFLLFFLQVGLQMHAFMFLAVVLCFHSNTFN